MILRLSHEFLERILGLEVDHWSQLSPKPSCAKEYFSSKFSVLSVSRRVQTSSLCRASATAKR